MKNLIIFLGIFLNIATFGQQTEVKNENPKSISEVPNILELRTKMKLDDVVTQADTPPEFPGGMEAFYRTFGEKMDVIEEKSRKINVRVYFIVEKNGFVRYVTALGENKKHLEAAETAIRRMFVRWKPAMINNEPVRFLYTFPLTLKKY
jgi:hypothetical protein